MTRPAVSLINGERGHRPRLDPERLPQEVSGAEGEAATGAEATMQRSQFDDRVFERHDQEERALLVPEEEVLGVPAPYGSAQRLRFLDRKQRRMAHRPVRNPEPIEEREEVVGARRHGVGRKLGVVAKSGAGA